MRINVDTARVADTFSKFASNLSARINTFKTGERSKDILIHCHRFNNALQIRYHGELDVVKIH